MIISHKYKFIFIKTRKTAGTSIERALVEHCGEDDVITMDHLHKGEEDVFAEYARNYECPWSPIREYVTCRDFMSLARVSRDWLKRPKFYNHMSALSVKSRVPPDIWDEYYKFTFERNPWDKCVSFYYWQSRRGKELGDFNDYINNLKGGKTIDQALPSDWRRYTYNNKIIVDDVYDFNDLQGSLVKALSKTLFPVDEIEIKIPHLKGKLRSKELVYTQQSSDVIQKHFFNEINAFNFVIPQGAINNY
jgi:hypothetical protein